MRHRQELRLISLFSKIVFVVLEKGVNVFDVSVREIFLLFCVYLQWHRLGEYSIGEVLLRSPDFLSGIDE
jgi:hypothetical protein